MLIYKLSLFIIKIFIKIYYKNMEEFDRELVPMD